MDKKKLETYDLIGKAKLEAELIAAAFGHQTRIVEEDGESFISTAEYNYDRINFHIKHNTVVDAYRG